MSSGVWAAPRASAPVRGTVTLPGSKSQTNRALVLAALADGPSTVRRPLRARDTQLMAAGLRTMGAGVDDAGSDWRVAPGVGRPARVDVGLAGTVARFLPAVAALGSASVHFHGDARMAQRPMAPLTGALRELGAQVDGDAIPLAVSGPVRGGAVTLDASSSSQLLSALLLVGASMPTGLSVRHVGAPLVSAPHVAMTVGMLRESGVSVLAEDGRWTVEPGPVGARDRVIEPDLSSASAFLAAAVATGGEVLVPGWPERTTQPGAVLPELLTAMGASYSLGAEGLRLEGSGAIHGLDADLRDASELALTITALAVLADSPSRLRGIGHIRLHETDRLTAVARELGRLGARIEVLDDGLAVTPAPLSGGVVLDPCADHRLAMAYAVVGLVVPDVRVEDVATTAKTVPGFVAMWEGLVR